MTTYISVFGSDAIPPTEYSYSAVTLSANTAFEWPQLATSANLISDIMEVTAGAGLTLTMPAANQVSTASPVLMRNTGSNTFTVADSTGGVITTISTGVAKFIYITSNSTAAGTWASFTYGTGSSSADSSALAGYGTKATSSTLSTKMPVTEKTTSWTVATADRAALFVATSGNLVATLPLVSTTANDFYLGIRNSGTGTVTVTPQTGELIDGQSTLALAPNESALIVCSGTAWYSLGYGRSTEFQFTKLVKSVTAGGTFTLTSAEASNKLLQFTGAPVSNTTIVVPNVVAVYYTQNTYTGSNTVTLKTAAGLGVATEANTRSIVYCDGTDVVLAQTSTTSSASISGGTAGAVLYQIATDSTGFTNVGTSGQSLLSGGTAVPTWGTPTSANGLNSATTTVAVSSATAPTSGQALIATSSTAATWQTLPGVAFTSIVAPYTVVAADIGKFFFVQGNTTITLTAAATIGASFYCYIGNFGSGNTVSINPNGSEKINGNSTSLPLSQGQSVLIVCDGTGWYVVSESSQSYVSTGGVTGTRVGSSLVTGNGAIGIGTNTAANTNTVSSDYAIGIGNVNVAAISAIGIGYGSINGARGIAQGYAVSVTADEAIAFGGNVTSNQKQATALGNYALADMIGKLAYASGQASTAGDAQMGQMVLRGTTTTNASVVLTSDGLTAGTNNQYCVPADKACAITGTLIGKQASSANIAAYTVLATLVNNGGTVTVPTGTLTLIGSDSIGLGTSPTLAADNTNKGLQVNSGNKTTTTIHWVMTITGSEVI